MIDGCVHPDQDDIVAPRRQRRGATNRAAIRSSAEGGAARSALASGATTIWYESPRRIRSTLADLAAVAPEAQVFIVREYTKLHEQHLLGTPQSLIAALSDPVRGEVAFAVAPQAGALAAPQPRYESASSAIDALLAEGHRVGEVAKLLAARGLGDRQQLYARAAARKARLKTSIKER